MPRQILDRCLPWLYALPLLLLLLPPPPVQANPAFARQTEMSCVACHAAFPRLNAFGRQFLADNIRLADWRERMALDTGDPQLALPKQPPLAIRAQTYVQARSARAQDANGNPVAAPRLDFQAPYLIKVLSGAPLSEHVSYYFYAILAEKGANGETVVEDAWIAHDDLFGSGWGLTLGQFQISDLMFARETRLTFQDFIPYRMAAITYERGALLSGNLGPLGIDLGMSNGNGIDANAKINSAGYARPDRAFDDGTAKHLYGRLGLGDGPLQGGLFALVGRQPTLSGRRGDKYILGLDLSGHQGALYWFAQLLVNQWGDMVQAGRDYRWWGGFAGIDWIRDDRWAFSLLYNYADAGDFDGTGTRYEGIDLNSLTLTASRYLARNVKALVEANLDLLPKDGRVDGIGHDTREHYLLVGFDLAF